VDRPSFYGCKFGEAAIIFFPSTLEVLDLAWLPDGRDLLTTSVDLSGRAYTVPIGFVSFPEGKYRQISRDTNSYSGLSVSGDGKVVATVQQQGNFGLYLLSAGSRTADCPAAA
jgi:WD40 repeat protein